MSLSEIVKKIVNRLDPVPLPSKTKKKHIHKKTAYHSLNPVLENGNKNSYDHTRRYK